MDYDQTIQLEIESLLRTRIGLNPESMGSRSIMRTVKRGMRAGKMKGLGDYLDALRDSPAVFEALVESIVVPETSFFRNRASFVFLRQWIAQEWSQRKAARQAKGEPLRVLSMPCSTGEEPYSIAITLLEENLNANDFQIDAVDISAGALAKAKEGVYSPYAFRRQTYRSDDKYFTLGVPEGAKGKRATQRYYLVELVRDAVSFSQENVLQPQALAQRKPYDIIFCRNLLIYFDKQARDRTFNLINKLLRPDGLLFVGYAETGLVPSTIYSPVPYPQTFAYRRGTDKTPSQEQASGSSLATSIAKRLEKATVTITAKAPSYQPFYQLEAQPKAQPEDQLEDLTLESVQQLADSGQIQAAAKGCDRLLAQQPALAGAHLLRGELYQMSGQDAEAEACFEKAIYLDNQMTEALTHLMFIKDARDDLAGVALIRARLKRIEASQTQRLESKPDS